MALITVVHDCDIERRGDGSSPIIAAEGDFRDCSLTENQPNQPSNGTLVVVQFLTGEKAADPYEMWGLLRFDLYYYIPADATITAAVWHFKVQYSSVVAGQPFYIKRCTRTDWLERYATWTDRRRQNERFATGGGNDYLDDTGESWETDHWATCTVEILSGTGAGQTRTIASNTATRLTVSSNWATNPDSSSFYVITQPWTTPGGDMAPPLVTLGDITTTGWKSFDIKTIVDDAWDNRSGILTFIMFRNSGADGGADGGISFYSKTQLTQNLSRVHHLRITYTLDSKTFQAVIL